MKEKYIEFVKENYKGKAQKLILNQIELFYKKEVINPNKYNKGELVKLKKGTYMHGIPGMLDNFNWILQNGFIGNDFTDQSIPNKIKGSIGMWDIQEECLLKDYIKNYSGFTICYTIGRGPGSKEIAKMIPYHQFDKITEEICNDEEIWTYWGDQTKEVRFMPSLVSNKRQIAFILNTENDYARELIKNDVWNPNLDEETLKSFIDYRYLPKFLDERINRNALTTDRETAIIFGLPPSLIEGVLVGRKLENDQEKIKYIKEKLPQCYICNVDGIVIEGNK